MATHSSILAWRIPWTEEPGGLQSMGSQRVVVSKEKPHQVPRFGISEGKHTGTPSKAAAAAAAKLLQWRNHARYPGLASLRANTQAPQVKLLLLLLSCFSRVQVCVTP